MQACLAQLQNLFRYQSQSNLKFDMVEAVSFYFLSEGLTKGLNCLTIYLTTMGFIFRIASYFG